MARAWLLVETLSAEPLVVADGTEPQNLIPLEKFLRRHPHRAAIETAIAESVQTGEPLTSITPKHGRVIRTEPVKMSDGRIHGVHVWSGPAEAEPPARPIPGALKWDLTDGLVTDTAESLANIGGAPDDSATHTGAFAEDLVPRELRPHETKVMALIGKAEPGGALCSSWDMTDWQGEPLRVGFAARAALEEVPDGSEHLVARGMNWPIDLDALNHATRTGEEAADQVLDALAQPGVHRALVDLHTWTLLRWVDEPCPFYNWRALEIGEDRIHPDDKRFFDGMAEEFATGPTARVLRMVGPDDTWVPLHMTISRVELAEHADAALVALRLPTDEELADSGVALLTAPDQPEPPPARRAKDRKRRKPRS